MSTPDAKKAALALAGSTTPTERLQAVRRSARRRIRFAIGEQQQALQQRIDGEDIADIHLAADVHTWSELAHALGDLWETRRRGS